MAGIKGLYLSLTLNPKGDRNFLNKWEGFASGLPTQNNVKSMTTEQERERFQMDQPFGNCPSLTLSTCPVYA